MSIPNPEARGQLVNSLKRAEAGLTMLALLMHSAAENLEGDTPSLVALPALIDLTTTFNIKPTDLLETTPDGNKLLEQIYGPKGLAFIQDLVNEELQGTLTPEKTKELAHKHSLIP